ncbi:hypothetical protein ABZ787_12315 [Micrococcus luteus]|uniref:TPR-repeat-containing protein n=1 Tax=Micrococcus luteus TaxID=1270 RepID=A0AAX0VI70_MICLU|nr:hypothetical protein AWM60_00175 [Micrococcus aloeverae]MBU8794161.1 hypothetical protein [Micrococcus luteus]MBY0170870.1 hypothetical protein [Micrococcus luteus]MBY0174837.1 hypothetical protein [Micrococcus luteus]MBY0179766.1 hypothetical protein [Micrococcus luteus]
MAEDTPRERREDRGSEGRGPRGGGDGRRRGGDRDGRPRSGAGDRRRSGGPHEDRRRGPGQGGGRPERRGAPTGPRREDRAERPAHNPGDLRAANRADQERSPDIDPDVTGQELDRGTLKEINGLDERPASWVAKHLVMAGRYLDVDPALAFQHALAASRKGGRLSRVREAVALTAYAAGEYADALREFRTYRRMTGDDTHIAAQVDSERALGRTEKALQLAAEVDASRLDRAARAELAMVVSGIREDAGDLQGAHEALQIPELDRRRGYPFSPRLFQRQADVLLALGRRDEARLWARAVRVAEKALGVGGFADPEIIDVDTEPVEDPRDRRPSPRDRRHERYAAEAGAEPTADGSPAEEPEAATEPTEAPRPEAAAEPPAAVDAPDEVDPNQLSLFDALEAPEADER